MVHCISPYLPTVVIPEAINQRFEEPLVFSWRASEGLGASNLLNGVYAVVLMCRIRPGSFNESSGENLVVKTQNDVRPVAIVVRVNVEGFIRYNIGSQYDFDRIAFGWHRFATSIKPFPDGLVAYHGTKLENVRAILSEGLKIRGGKETAAHGECFGAGIYTTPDLDLASRFCNGGREVLITLELSIRPNSFDRHLAHGYDYWVVRKSEDVLITGFLAKH